MKPEQIKSACERQWQRHGIVSHDRPAGWIEPDNIPKGVAYWAGEKDELWPAQTRKLRPDKRAGKQ
jgi:hypothetical protein